jgi:hypothetical protein
MKINLDRCNLIGLIQGFVATLLSMALTSPVLADRIPYYFSGTQYYNSTSMEPVTVNFMWPDYNRPESKIRDTVHLPRAYIVFAAGYASRPTKNLGKYFAESQRHGYDRLPDTIQTNTVRILATYPDGEPYSVALRKWGRKAREEYMGTKLAHAKLYIAQLTYISDSHPMPLAMHTVKYEKGEALLEYDGLLYNPKRSNPNYYNKPSDPYFFASCSDPLEKARPAFMCKYAIPLGPNYLAMVDFLDFRLFGGRAFADERIGAFQRAMCQYFPC